MPPGARGRSGTSPIDWPLPQHGSTAAFSLLKRTRQRIEGHHHLDHQLIVPLRGRLVFRVGEARAEVQQPQALFLTARTPHALEAPSGEVDLFALQVAPAALEGAAALLGVDWSPPPEGFLTLERVTPLLREVMHQLMFHADVLEGSGTPPAGAAMTYAYFCVTLMERLSREQPSPEPAAWTFRSPYVERAVAVLHAQLTAPLSLPELARRVGTSPRNLSREFQKELGVSPVRYTARLRLDEAARALQRTDAPVKEIALSLGFVSVPRFTTAFRAAMGCTPLEHRAKRRG